jgi:class 3 adenylate cyclase/predicted ATPase
MATQPTGTVTFLFTDVEGSTGLLERLGREGYASALQLHRRLLRESFAAHDGYEVSCEGDEFFVAFARAEDAVAAAGQAQAALLEAEWPQGEPFRVRMGIHTGEPLAMPTQYIGIDVHKTARVMAAAHGGQVLLSASTHSLIAGVDVVDLGTHRLKDIREPVRLWQLVTPPGPRAFPPLRTLAGRATNLPAAVSDFVGRHREVEEVVALLREGSHRLVTLTGLGGVGKSRLALHVATSLVDEFDAVWLVRGRSVSRPELALSELAAALGIVDDPSRPVVETIAEAIGERRTLVVLDGVEQLLPDVGRAVTELLERCATTQLLVTSRRPLAVPGEFRHLVPPLDETDAIDLLVSRAQAAGADDARDDASLAEVARRLDRLPLALELAAARLTALSPDQLLDRLDDALLRPSAATTSSWILKKTFDWTYDLLDERDRTLLARLSIFAAPATLGEVEHVCGGTIGSLNRLVEAGLVRRTPANGAATYDLYTLVKTYAREQLVGPDLDEVAAAHARFFLGGGRGPSPDATALELRVVLDRLETSGRRDETRHAAATLAELLGERGRLREQETVVHEVLQAGAPAAEVSAADLLRPVDAALAERDTDTAIVLAQGIVRRSANAAEDVRAAALLRLAYGELEHGRRDRALSHFLRTLRLAEGDDVDALASVLDGLAAIASTDGRTSHAARLAGHARALREGLSPRHTSEQFDEVQERVRARIAATCEAELGADRFRTIMADARAAKTAKIIAEARGGGFPDA